MEQSKSRKNMEEEIQIIPLFLYPTLRKTREKLLKNEFSSPDFRHIVMDTKIYAEREMHLCSG
jgi:hypothetical protein